jgi:hypothetical protein
MSRPGVRPALNVREVDDAAVPAGSSRRFDRDDRRIVACALDKVAEPWNWNVRRSQIT